MASRVFVLALLLSGAEVSAANLYYVGPDGGSWSNPTHWSVTPGGTGGAGVPVAGDTVYVMATGAPRTVVFDVVAPPSTDLAAVWLSGDGGGVLTTGAGTLLKAGVVGIGHNGGTGGGTGTGHASVTSHGEILTEALWVGSPSGGTGTLSLSGGGDVRVGAGGVSVGNVTITNGTLTVLGSTVPPGTDPVLERSVVAGYLQDGTLTLGLGAGVFAPKVKIGVTPGMVGTLVLNRGGVSTDYFEAANGAGSVIQFNGGGIICRDAVVDTGSRFVVGDGVSSPGLRMQPVGGTHFFADGLTIARRSHLLTGGTVVGDVENLGTISPLMGTGASPTFPLDGDLSLGASSILQVPLFWSSMSWQVAVTGNVTLGGQLHLYAVNSAQPGLTFDIVTAASRSGEFQSVLSQSSPGVAFRVRYTPTGVSVDTLTDGDRDGVGDVDDNCPGTPNQPQADLDQDGQGDSCDLDDGRTLFTSITKSVIAWQAESASSYNLYRSSFARLLALGEYTQDPLIEPQAAQFCNLLGSSQNESHNPPVGQLTVYLVTHETGGVESSLGNRSNGTPRPNTHPCP